MPGWLPAVYLEASLRKANLITTRYLERVITMMTHSHYANDLSFAGSRVPLFSPPLNGYDTRDRLTIARSQVPEVKKKKTSGVHEAGYLHGRLRSMFPDCHRPVGSTRGRTMRMNYTR
jgi:hypothetical protein